LCIRSSLLCEPVLLRVAIATSCDTLVHATDKTWYTVLYHHTMYVVSVSNILIKTNFKQIARVELKCVQYCEGDYILCMTSRYFFRSFTNVRLLCFVSHSNDMTSCQSSSAENVSCNVAPFFYHQCGDTTSCIRRFVSDRQLSLISKENVYNVR
jgi:hypothetical protein